MYQSSWIVNASKQHDLLGAQLEIEKFQNQLLLQHGNATEWLLLCFT